MVNRYEVVADPYAPNNAHAFLLGMVGSNKRVLELGAATGHVTKALVAAGCDVAAVEYDAEWAKDLAEVASSVHVLDLNDPAWVRGFTPEFDVITAGDVLEHLLDPVRTLREMTSLLAPNGYIVISLPHIAHADIRLKLLQGAFEYTPTGLLDETHIRFFTYAAVSKLVADCGLAITELKRVRFPAFETEQAVPRSSVPNAVLDVVMADPEAETYQFVFTAVPVGADEKVQQMSERALAADRAVEDLTVRVADLEEQAAQLQRERDRARTKVVGLRTELRKRRAEVTRLRNSRTLRYTAWLRRLYKAVRR